VPDARARVTPRVSLFNRPGASASLGKFPQGIEEPPARAQRAMA